MLGRKPSRALIGMREEGCWALRDLLPLGREAEPVSEGASGSVGGPEGPHGPEHALESGGETLAPVSALWPQPAFLSRVGGLSGISWRSGMGETAGSL